MTCAVESLRDRPVTWSFNRLTFDLVAVAIYDGFQIEQVICASGSACAWQYLGRHARGDRSTDSFGRFCLRPSALVCRQRDGAKVSREGGRCTGGGDAGD